MPPEKRPGVERGGKSVEDDPERNQGTQAKVRIPTVERGGKGGEDDPEANKGTQARLRAAGGPAVERGGKGGEDDPERNQGTQARAKMPPPRKSRGAAKGEEDWEAPPGRMSREQKKDESYRTGSAYASMDEDDPEYQTGNDYKPLSEKDLEGDGLEALEPDMGPSKTTALPAGGDEDEESDDDEEDDSGATNAGRPLKLEIIAGPDTGKKKKFKGVRMKVGRTPGVDLLLKDQSVSRIHFELVAGDKGVLLRDLGSGNGTKVNGEKVAEKVLSHGDEIAIGKTKIRFVDELAAFQKAQEEAEQKKDEAEAKAKAEAEGKPEEKAEGEAKEGEEKAEGEEKPEGEGEGEGGEEGEEKSKTSPRAPRIARRRNAEPQGLVEKFKALPRQKQILFGGGAGVGLLLFLLVIISALSKPPPPKVDPRKEQAQARMQAARDAVRAGHYDEAVKAVEEAEKLFPGVDVTHLGNQARDELAVMRGLDAVRTLIGQERFDDARTELARIPKGSNKAEDDKKVVEEELKQAEAKYKRAKVEELLAAGDIDAAKQIFTELPDSDQRELAPKITAAEDELEKQKQDQERAEKNRQIAGVNAQKQRHEEEMAIAFAVVTRKFLGNEWDRAASECDRVIDQHPGDEEIRKKAKMLQGRIPAFGRYYEEGKKKYQLGQLGQAAKPLHKAKEYLDEMGLAATGKLHDELADMISESSVVAAKDALLRSDLASAAQYLRDAVKMDPSNNKAKDLLLEVAAKAGDLYQEAYMIRDREPREARRKFQTVVDSTPAGSEFHEKAKNQLAAMPP